MSYDISGKVVLITGAAGGIGAATARRLYARGADLVLADRQQSAVDALAAEFDTNRVLAVALDVTDSAASHAVVRQAVDRFGHLDVVLANAGIAWKTAPATLASCDAAEFEQILEVNLLGVWRTIRAALPDIVRNQGQILVTSSIYAALNGMANAPYAASKAAVEALGRALRTELAGTGASASVVYPGWTATALTKIAFGGDALATQLSETALPAVLRRAVRPEAVAEAIARGLRTRQARIVVPARWRTLLALRGLLDPLSDRYFDNHDRIHDLLRRIEATTNRSGPGVSARAGRNTAADTTEHEK